MPLAGASRDPDFSLEPRLKELEARFAAHEYNSNTTTRRHGEQIADLVQQKSICATVSNMTGELSNQMEDMTIEVRRHIEMHRYLGLAQMQEAGEPINIGLGGLKAKITGLETRLTAMEKERSAAAAVEPQRSSSLAVKRPLADSGSPEPRPSRVVMSKARKSEGASEDSELSQPQVGRTKLGGESGRGITHSLQSILYSIKFLDFLSTAQLTTLNRQVASSASASFEYPIFHYDYPREATEIFYLKIGGAMANYVLPSPREDFDFATDRRAQSLEDLSAVHNSGIIECVLSGRDVNLDPNQPIPDFLLPLGEIYRRRIHHTSHKGRDTNEATNFFVFLSVPHKSLWAMYRYERFTKEAHERLTKGAQKPKRINFKPEDRLFKRGKLSDVFCLLKHVGEWESYKKEMLQTNRQVVDVFGVEREKAIYEPLFAVPLWDDLRQRLENEATVETMQEV
jgi:hypothetical protein